jgi:uncharacterized protein (DUF3820 family)
MAKRPTFSGMDLTNVFTQTGQDAEEQQQKQPIQRMASRIQVNRQSTYSIQISAIRPDRYQARHVLPRQLRGKYFNNELDWREVGKQWIQLARKDSLVRNELDELMQLGRSLDQDGQIKPITGSFIKNEAGEQIFLILTGERRYWATVIRTVMSGDEEEPNVLALVDEDPTVRKQILENITHKPLTAIGKARAIARIILEEADVLPDPGETEDEYFKKMFDVKTTAETAQLIEETLGISQYQYYRFRKLLELPVKLQYMADQADIPEGILRQLMSLSDKDQAKAIEYYLKQEDPPSVREFQRLLEEDALDKEPTKKRKPRTPKPPVVKITGSFNRSVNKMRVEMENDPEFLDKAASEIVGSMKPDNVKAVVGVLETLIKRLNIRNKNRK